LIAACNQNHYEILDYLKKIYKNEFIDIINKHNILHFAVDNNNIYMVKKILTYKPDLNFKDNEQWTALHYAAKRDNFDIAELLIKEGAIINIENDEWDTPLHIACKKRNETFIHHILNRYYNNIINVNYFNKNGNTPLHLASANNNDNIVRILLENGAKADAINDKNETSLHIAVKYNDIKIINLLLEKDPNIINKVTSEGKTPLYYAVQYNHIASVNFLLRYNPDINIEAFNNMKPIDVASNINNKIIFNILSKNKYSSNIYDKELKLNEFTIIDDIKKVDLRNNDDKKKEVIENYSIINKIRSKDANLDTTDNSGWSALHWACYYNNYIIVKELLKKGADSTSTTSKTNIPDIIIDENKSKYLNKTPKEIAENNINGGNIVNYFNKMKMKSILKSTGTLGISVLNLCCNIKDIVI